VVTITMGAIKKALIRATTNGVDATRSGHLRTEAYWDGYGSALRHLLEGLE
jgi:hypothetical protein